MTFALFNRNVPDELHQRLGEGGPAGVRVLAFTPSGGWVLIVKGGYIARGIPDECFAKIGEYHAAGHEIRVVAFPPAGGNRFLIVTDQTYFARNIPDECYQRLGTMWNAGARPTCVAFPPAGGNRWVILAGRELYARGIDDECFQRLVNDAQGLRPARRVAFTPTGGWVILARDRFFARRIPDECYDKMREMSADVEIDHVAFMKSGGWSIVSNNARTALPADPLRTFESQVLKVDGQWQGVRERMAAHKVPGVGIALVQGNRIAWACSYGQVAAGSADWVHNDTVFQAASCSKPVSALGFLQLVDDGKLGLDDNVNPKLGWTLPRRPCAPASWLTQVTLRRLLQHRGGIIGRNATNPTDACSNFTQDNAGGGFGGYVNKAGVGVPTVREVLDGASARAGVQVNSHRVELSYEPNAMSAYSGEGFVLMMQLLENQRGVGFGTWMAGHVLAPAGMQNSTFDLAAPSFSGPPASGHGDDGKVIAGQRRRHPEGAAAGLYTTASDLCRFIIAMNQGGRIGGQALISTERHTAMRASALGMPWDQLDTAGENFRHNGSNVGFKCVFRGMPKRQAGFAILTNGDGGDELYGELVTALDRVYGWA